MQTKEWAEYHLALKIGGLVNFNIVSNREHGFLLKTVVWHSEYTGYSPSLPKICFTEQVVSSFCGLVT